MLIFCQCLPIFLRYIAGIPYTAHGAQIPPPLIFDFCLFIVLMPILGKVRLGEG